MLELGLVAWGRLVKISRSNSEMYLLVFYLHLIQQSRVGLNIGT